MMAQQDARPCYHQDASLILLEAADNGMDVIACLFD